MSSLRRPIIQVSSDPNHRIVHEQQAIASVVKKYKLNYLNKAIQTNNLDTFVRFCKELILLLISHCQNVVCIAPEKASNSLEDLSLLFDDVVNKYYQTALKLSDKYSELSKQQAKLIPNSELCSVCSQQIKKVQIDQTMKSLLNEAHIFQKGSTQQKQQQEDLQFFAEVNDLLNNRYGELMKNQMEMKVYQDVAISAINSLNSLKSYFSRNSVVLPDKEWIEEAREEMRKMLKENFNGKIPPWIEKMYTLFWTLSKREARSRQKDQGVQTTNNAHSQILQLKKKLLRSNQKLAQSQNKIKIHQHQIITSGFQKKDLQQKLEYYKKEIAKLINEIESIKSQNQSIKLKLSNDSFRRNSENQSKTQISSYSRDNIIPIESSRSRRMKNSQQNSLPKILRSSDQNRNSHKKRESDTSLNMFGLGQSQSKGESKQKRPYKLSAFISSEQNFNREYNNGIRQNTGDGSRTQPISPMLSKDYQAQFEDNIIHQQEGQAMLEEQKKKLIEVNDQIKQLVEKSRKKKLPNQYLINSMKSPTNRESLKRIPRKTARMDMNDNSLSKTGQLKSIYRLCDEVNSQGEKLNSTLVKIYHYLRSSGYLVKLTEEEFKKQILKINEIDMNVVTSQEYKNALDAKLTHSHHNNTFQKAHNRLSWNQETFYMTNEGSQRELKDQYKKYHSIFTNEQNAYNYELSLTKNHLKGVCKMTKVEDSLCQQFFQIIQKIKQKNFSHYKFFCSFLRYPYQVMKNDFGLVNLVNDMKYENFHGYFQRLLAMHTKCKKQEGSCCHFKELKANMISKTQ